MFSQAGSTETAPDEALADWKRCEALLRTRKWIRANTITCKGAEARLEMICKAGLPAMKVISASTIEQLGRIPRSTEGHAIDAIDAVRKHGADDNNYSKAVLVMFSHRWKRPQWCEALGKDVAWGSDEHSAALAAGHYIGDPDDAEHSKARALINWAKWFKDDVSKVGILGTKSGTFQTLDLSPKLEEVYFWIDWPCVDQTNPAPGVAALPTYVSTCHAICAAWNDEYADRAWCRVELITAQAFMRTGDRIFVCEETSAPLLTGQRVHKERVQVLHPLDGKLTNEDDRKVVQRLQEAAFESTAFSCCTMARTEMSTSVGECLIISITCFGCFGMDYLERSRVPGQTKMQKITPVTGTATPVGQPALAMGQIVQPQMMQMQIMVPPGVAPGQPFVAALPDGQQMQVRV